MIDAADFVARPIVPDASRSFTRSFTHSFSHSFSQGFGQ
jgi:hypothetical protein